MATLKDVLEFAVAALDYFESTGDTGKLTEANADELTTLIQQLQSTEPPEEWFEVQWFEKTGKNLRFKPDWFPLSADSDNETRILDNEKALACAAIARLHYEADEVRLVRKQLITTVCEFEAIADESDRSINYLVTVHDLSENQAKLFCECYSWLSTADAARILETTEQGAKQVIAALKNKGLVHYFGPNEFSLTTTGKGLQETLGLA